MTEWEYMTRHRKFMEQIAPSDTPNEWVWSANEYGREGWELIAIDGGLCYFKRPVEPGLKDGFLIMKQCCECENAQWAVDDNV